MSGHHHSSSHAVSAAGKHRSRLAITFALVAGFFAVELIAALRSGSLALLGDAGHMAADVTALGAALLALHLAPSRDKRGRRTFGNYRVEVFASGLAVLIMLGVAIFITVEAIGRFGSAVEPASGIMLAVGIHLQGMGEAQLRGFTQAGHDRAALALIDGKADQEDVFATGQLTQNSGASVRNT